MDASALSFEMGDRLSALGSPVGDPVELQPPSLRFYAGSILLLVLGLGGLAGAYFLYTSDNAPGAYLLGGAALACAAIGAAQLGRRSAMRGRVQVYDHGFAVTRGPRLEAIPFEGIVRLDIEEKERLDNGRHAGWWRSLTAAGPQERVRIQHFSPEGADDVVGRLLAHVLEKTADAADKRRVETPLRGKGWVLDSEGLHAREGAPAVRLDEITQTAMFEGNVALWRGTEQEPFFAVKDSTANARVLMALAERHRAKDVEADPATLGRVLFQKKSSKFLAILLLFLGVPQLVGAVALLAGSEENRFAVAPVLGALGVAFTLGGLWMLFARFQCFERGLRRRTLFGARTLRYAEIEHFSYQSVRHYHNGAYTGTHVSMSFRPEAGRAVSFSTTTMGNDQDLDFLRDQVSRMVASRLYEAVGRGAEIGWGRNARLTKDGLVFYAEKLIGRGPLTSLPWAAAATYSLQDGVFALYPPEGGKPLLKLGVGEDNFFPGLLVYQQMVGEALEPPKA